MFPKELLRQEKEWLTDVGHNLWWHMQHAQHAVHKPKFEKMGLFRHPCDGMERLKDPPTWMKVTTTLEKDPSPDPPDDNKPLPEPTCGLTTNVVSEHSPQGNFTEQNSW